jgi:hypothetical protein
LLTYNSRGIYTIYETHNRDLFDDNRLCHPDPEAPARAKTDHLFGTRPKRLVQGWIGGRIGRHRGLKAIGPDAGL